MSLSLNLFLKRVVLGGVVIFWAALGCSPEHDSTSTPDAEQVTYRDAQAIETDGVYQVNISEHILDIGTMTVGHDGEVYMTAPGAYEVLAFDAEGSTCAVRAVWGKALVNLRTSPGF
jgi:hypothetical protein